MDDTSLGKLRRFSLTGGLFLITYVAAGISVEPNVHLSAFGLPFRISRPDLLPTGIALASLSGAVRFYYYALMLAASPYRKRRDLMDSLTVHHDEYVRPGQPIKPAVIASGSQVSMYWGSRKFTSPTWHSDRKIMEVKAMAFDNAFPKFAGARAGARIVSKTFSDDDGLPNLGYCIEVIIPRRCRIAAIFEDLDYTAPVWLNAVALLLFIWKFPY